MLFSSMIFLWMFLPIVLIIYYVINLITIRSSIRIRLKNLFLLVASLVFYAWGGIHFLSIMLCSIVINFLGGYIISLQRDEGENREVTLVITIALNLFILFYFKYFNMIIVVAEQVMNTGNTIGEMFLNILNMQRTNELAFTEIVLPIGISFFTFQAMSYVIDVYRRVAKPQKNIFDFALYVALFPQLIAGPIVKYSDVADQIKNRQETLDKFAIGVKRFCYGLGKKVIIANTCAEIVDGIWGLELNHVGSLIALLGMFMYTLQIYYDFSGYSDMAIGLGKMFGFDFKENFKYPYVATSLIDFWRRWHISLSNWFKEYVYIPLGGSREGIWTTCQNIFIVFFLTGIWHGANFTFILWGILYAVLQIFERLWFKKVLDNNKLKFLNHIYTFLVVSLLWVLFRANTINDACTYIGQMFVIESKYSVLTYLSMKVILVIVVAILGCGVIQSVFGKLYDKYKNMLVIQCVDVILQIVILLYSILLITSGTYNPFIYFQF